jgi:hypothetical protein
MDQPAQDTPRGEVLQVSAGLAEPLSKTLDISNPETPTDQAVEIDTAGNQVASSFFVRKPTTTRQH